MDISHAIMSRLVDNYEWQTTIEPNDWRDFITVLSHAVATSQYFHIIESMAMQEGIIESDYFV